MHRMRSSGGEVEQRAGQQDGEPQHEAGKRCPPEPTPSGGAVLSERVLCAHPDVAIAERSEEHTSELQSRQYLVCRLLLEKKKKQNRSADTHRRNCRTPTDLDQYNT